MRVELQAGAVAAQQSAIKLGEQAMASADPLDFVRGATTMNAGTLSAVIGREKMIQILMESATVLRAAIEIMPAANKP